VLDDSALRTKRAVSGAGSRNCFHEHDGPIPVAHRGGAGEAQPNSERAFALTAELGFYLETDVAVTRDGVPVLCHPRGIARLQTWRTLAFTVESHPIQRLDDLLSRHASLPLMLDVKQWPAVAPTAIAVARADAVDRVSIGTFSQARTDATARAILELTGRRVCTALSARALARLALGRPPEPHDAWPRIAQVPHRLITRRFLARAHDARIKVVAWTINTDSEMHRLLDLGVDGIMTDYPSRLRAVLLARGTP
jgi:glycerophosphoryl diester phosphodiesterase